MQYKITRNFFEGGQKCRTLHLSDKKVSEEWVAKQQASMDDYHQTHVPENVDAAIKSIYALFKGYISNALVVHFRDNIKSAKVLDVGCGIFKTVPPYIGNISESAIYVGLDPIDENYERDYLFIHGRIEDLNAQLSGDSKFDLFVFSSTLDHFESIDAVADEIKKLANPGAIAVFFVGLNEAFPMSQMFGCATYKKVFSGNLSTLHFLKEWAITALYRLPHMFLYLRGRQNKIKNGLPLDTLHFYYFTNDNIAGHVGKFGEITDITPVTGTNAMFVTCKIGMGK